MVDIFDSIRATVKNGKEKKLTKANFQNGFELHRLKQKVEIGYKALKELDENRTVNAWEWGKAYFLYGQALLEEVHFEKFLDSEVVNKQRGTGEMKTTNVNEKRSKGKIHGNLKKLSRIC